MFVCSSRRRLRGCHAAALHAVLACLALFAGCEPAETSAVEATSGGGGEQACLYPPPPYGKALGEVLAGSYAWEGFPAHTTTSAIVSIDDFYDCDGAAGVAALLFVTVGYTCQECQAHLLDLEARMATWEQEGVRIVVLVGSGASGPATVEDAATWKSSLDLEALAVVADPTFSLVPEGETGLPNQALVDPRTMRVVHRRTGFDDDYAELELLVAQNQSL